MHSDLIEGLSNEELATADFGFKAKGKYISRSQLEDLTGTTGAVGLSEAIETGELNPNQVLKLQKEREPNEEVLKPIGERVFDEPPPAPSKTAPKSDLKAGDKVVHTDLFGDKQQGTYLGITPDGQARVRFDGERDVVKMSHKGLEATGERSNAPEFATVQKSKVQKIKSSNAKAKVQDDVPLSEWLDEPHVPDDIPDEIKGQDFSDDETTPRGVGPSVSPKPSAELIPPRPFSSLPNGWVPKTVVSGLNKIVEAVKTATNKHLEIGYAKGEEMRGAFIAQAGAEGHIHFNANQLIGKFDRWHSMDSAERGQALSSIALTMGHEVGHVTLAFIREKEPALYDRLMSEFKNIHPIDRANIIGKWLEGAGMETNHANNTYLSGDPFSMMEAYGLDVRQSEDVDHAGLHEFFAEMSAAHIAGKLKEGLLPPEMKGVWDRIKQWISGLTKKLLNIGFEHDGSAESKQSLANFRDAMGEAHDKFATLQEGEYRNLSERAHARDVAETRRIKAEQASFEQQSQLERVRAEEYAAKQAQDWGIDYDADYTEESSPYGRPFGRPVVTPGKNATTAHGIVGNKAFIEAEMAKHLGYGIGGALAGGILGPKLTDNQITVAEGVFAGGVLGFAGPIALRRLFQTMPKATGATFQHMSAKEAFGKLFTMNNLRDLGGDAASGQGSAPAKFVRWLERNLNLHLPPQLFNAVVESEGPASYAINIASDALSKARNFKTDSAMDAAVEKYLRGKSTDADLRTALGGNKDAQEFGNFVITGRNAIGILQDMFASGLKSGSFKTKVLESLRGRRLPDTHVSHVPRCGLHAKCHTDGESSYGSSYFSGTRYGYGTYWCR